jgi:hypothetical protein
MFSLKSFKSRNDFGDIIEPFLMLSVNVGLAGVNIDFAIQANTDQIRYFVA